MTAVKAETRPLVLVRDESTTDGVFGTLAVPAGGLLLVPLAGGLLQKMEDDWLSNARGLSAVPAGRYPIRRYLSPKHGYEVFRLFDVPGRDYCELHPANTEEDVEGCIGPGLARGHKYVQDEDDPLHPWAWKRSVTSSREAFHLLMQWMAPVDEATLVIEWAPGVRLP